VIQYVFETFPEIQQASGFTQSMKSYIDRVKKSEDLDFGMTAREWKELKEKIK
jgi:hypothetical protein